MIIARCLLMAALVAIVLEPTPGLSQNMAADVKGGLSFFSGNGSSTGLLFGGALDIPMDPNLFFRPEINITTHGGTPIELAGLIKYHLPETGTKTTFYLDGGLGLWFYSGGSSIGVDLGGGAIFPLEDSNIRIPAEIRVGPIFESGTTVFQITLSSGVRFSLE